MPELTDFALYTHQLDTAQIALLERVLDHFHDAQPLIKVRRLGERSLGVTDRKVSWFEVRSAPQPSIPEITVTGLPLEDNWFAHTWRNHSLITGADWGVAFGEEGAPPANAPDAYLLQELCCAVMLAATLADEIEVSHSQPTGCLSDMCAYKPQMALKLRCGYLCDQCRDGASQVGISGVYLDHIQALLDRARLLAMGRVPQTHQPDTSDEADAQFLLRATTPEGFAIPPLLLKRAQEWLSVRHGRLRLVPAI